MTSFSHQTWECIGQVLPKGVSFTLKSGEKLSRAQVLANSVSNLAQAMMFSRVKMMGTWEPLHSELCHMVSQEGRREKSTKKMMQKRTKKGAAKEDDEWEDEDMELEEEEATQVWEDYSHHQAQWHDGIFMSPPVLTWSAG